MAETNPQITDRESRRIRDTAPFVLTGLSAGHGIFHWFSQSFFVMLPEVKNLCASFLITVPFLSVETHARDMTGRVKTR